jgi:hypothetical protein
VNKSPIAPATRLFTFPPFSPFPGCGSRSSILIPLRILLPPPPQLKLYQLVIEDVVTNVRDAFLDEGVDEQVLQEMKQIWTNRLMASKAVDVLPEPLAPQSQPAILANNPKVSHGRGGFDLHLSCIAFLSQLHAELKAS